VALIFPSRHPLILAKLAKLRAVSTEPAEFRGLVRRLAMLLAAEATADLAIKPIEVQTPLDKALGAVLSDTVGIVPILRAGLGMADGVLELIPDAEVRHIGLFRDEQTLLPTEYYHKPPHKCRISLALMVDPMLATGGSAIRACEVIRSWGVRRIKVLSIIAAPEGIDTFSRAFPDIPVHVAAVDDRLNEIGFISPGLGDAGDRQFATFHH
jgi:uracil phosphoribosyltransferase